MNNGNKALRELISSRPSGEIKNGLVEVEIEKLTLHNFTLQTPIQDIETNMVVSTNKIHLSECSPFALNCLFSFFLKQDKQIEEISFEKCKMDPSYDFEGS